MSRVRTLWKWTDLKGVTALISVEALLILSFANWGIAILHKKDKKP